MGSFSARPAAAGLRICALTDDYGFLHLRTTENRFAGISGEAVLAALHIPPLDCLPAGREPEVW